MVETADIVIVGAGIIGLCSALRIARRTRAKIVVLDRGPGLGEGSTGASSAVCRAKYTRDETVKLARDGIAAYRNWPDFVGLADPLARFHGAGVVWIGGDDRPRTEMEVRRLNALGVAAIMLDDDALLTHYPALNPCPIPPDLVRGDVHACTLGGAHLLEVDGGYIDPMDALQDLLRAVRALGVEVRLRTAARSVKTSGGAIAGVSTASGDIACGAQLNAAGPWCPALDAMAGLANRWPLRATRIQIVHVDRSPGIIGPLPVCADPAGGIYFRPHNDGQQIVVGSVLEADEKETVDPDDFYRGVDDMFVAEKLHALAHRVRGFDAIRNMRGYSGLYTMNQRDVHPIVGCTPIVGY